MRRAPAERVALRIAGNSSGDSPTARAMANIRVSSGGRSRNRLSPSTAVTITSITRSSRPPNWRRPRSNSVSGGRSTSERSIWPSSVCRPQRTASRRAVPLRSEVPRNRQLSRCARAASLATRLACFCTGKVSPVSRAWLTKQSRASTSRPSAGIRLPAESSTISPGTTSSAARLCRRPSRQTSARLATCSRRRAIARLERTSCRLPTSALAMTMASTIRASSQSWAISATSAPINRISTSGLHSWRSSEAPTCRARFGRYVRLTDGCRAAAASLASPFGPVFRLA